MTNLDAIRQRVEAVRERIDAARARVGRVDPVTIVAVTKTFPEETVRAALRTGLTDFGENRVQELADKSKRLGENPEANRPTWHLIGPIQSNKANVAAAHADLIHALDRPKIARRLNRMGEELERAIEVLVQVNISSETQKHGIAPDELDAFLELVGDLPNLRVRGLMGMAELASSEREFETVVRPQFRQLRSLYDAYAKEGGFSVLSMGMSGDFEVAIEEGATHVRIGRAIFGSRA